MRLSYCTVVIPYLTNSTLIIFLWDVIGKTEWRDNSNRLLPGSFFKNRYLDLQKWLLNLNSSSSNTQLQFILELRRTELLIVHVKVTRSAFKNKRRAPKGQVGSRGPFVDPHQWRHHRINTFFAHKFKDSSRERVKRSFMKQKEEVVETSLTEGEDISYWNPLQMTLPRSCFKFAWHSKLRILKAYSTESNSSSFSYTPEWFTSYTDLFTVCSYVYIHIRWKDPDSFHSDVLKSYYCVYSNNTLFQHQKLISKFDCSESDKSKWNRTIVDDKRILY